jgi:hypothetical protein
MLASGSSSWLQVQVASRRDTVHECWLQVEIQADLHHCLAAHGHTVKPNLFKVIGVLLAGLYLTSKGASSGTACTQCSAGRYSDASGASSSTTCAQCVEGKYSNAAGSTACTDCPRGTYLTTKGASSGSACTQCVAGKASNALGAVSATVCTDCVATSTFASTPGSTQCTAGPQFF